MSFSHSYYSFFVLWCLLDNVNASSLYKPLVRRQNGPDNSNRLRVSRDTLIEQLSGAEKDPLEIADALATVISQSQVDLDDTLRGQVSRALDEDLWPTLLSEQKQLHSNVQDSLVAVQACADSKVLTDTDAKVTPLANDHRSCRLDQDQAWASMKGCESKLFEDEASMIEACKETREAHKTQEERCDELQEMLETEACNEAKKGKDCDSYVSCHASKLEAFQLAKDEASESINLLSARERALNRISCLITSEDPVSMCNSPGETDNRRSMSVDASGGVALSESEETDSSFSADNAANTVYLLDILEPPTPKLCTQSDEFETLLNSFYKGLPQSSQAKACQSECCTGQESLLAFHPEDVDPHWGKPAAFLEGTPVYFEKSKEQGEDDEDVDSDDKADRPLRFTNITRHVNASRTYQVSQTNTSANPAPILVGRHNWLIKLPEGWSDPQVKEFGRHFPTRDKYEGHPSRGGLSMLIVWSTGEELQHALKKVPGAVYIELDSEMVSIPELDSVEHEPWEFPKKKSSSSLMESEEESEEETQQLDPPSWGLDRIDDRKSLDRRYEASGVDGGRGVHNYVFDTGIRTTHVDFGGRAIPTLEVLGVEVVECSPVDAHCAVDKHGHGTHAAAIIGGTTYGVAKDTTVHSVKILTNEGKGNFAWFIQAVDWVIVNGKRPAVITAPVVGRSVWDKSRAVKDAIDKAAQNGIMVVVGAGNDGKNGCTETPGYIPTAVTVGATDKGDTRSNFSNYGPCLHIFAPGSKIESAGIGSDSTRSVTSGTAAAAAHVAGAASLILSQYPKLTPSEVNHRMVSDSTPGAITDAGAGSPNKLLFVQGSMGLQEVLIGDADAATANSTGTRKHPLRKCVVVTEGLRCASNAGDPGHRLNDDTFSDTFQISVQGNKVCAEKTNNLNIEGWTIPLKIMCHAHTLPPPMDMWRFELVSNEPGVVCSHTKPTDRKNNYYLLYDYVRSIQECQNLCRVHEGCKGVSMRGESRCEVWLKEILSFVRLPAGHKNAPFAKCLRMMGRGIPGSGLIRLASSPKRCIGANPEGKTKNGEPLRVMDCDLKSSLQQFNWTGVGPVHWVANPKKCLHNINGGMKAGNEVVLWDCAANDLKQNFAFMGAGMVYWAAIQDCWALNLKDGKLDRGNIVQLAACSHTKPSMQFFN
eukprot:TRINITY_DN6558_c4_g1_i1.p1 TRINITY_DN6558_c4_g1~~TRINITY_DN6558_c4_g1_i1.p1  ORF type:complete len:1159 (-),score=227.34 TRINITY_DN6558_c4_g1_i1:509-3985(-)